MHLHLFSSKRTCVIGPPLFNPPILTQTTFPAREMLRIAISGVSLDPRVCFPPSFLGTVRKDFHLELILDMGGWALHAGDESDS